MMQSHEVEDDFTARHIRRLSSKAPKSSTSRRRNSISDMFKNDSTDNNTWAKVSNFFMTALKDEAENPDSRKKSNRRRSRHPERKRRTYSLDPESAKGVMRSNRDKEKKTSVDNSDPNIRRSSLRRSSMCVPKSSHRKSVFKKVHFEQLEQL